MARDAASACSLPERRGDQLQLAPSIHPLYTPYTPPIHPLHTLYTQRSRTHCTTAGSHSPCVSHAVLIRAAGTRSPRPTASPPGARQSSLMFSWTDATV